MTTLTEQELTAFIQRVLPSARVTPAGIRFPPLKTAQQEFLEFCFPDGDYADADWEPEAIGRHVRHRLTAAEFSALHWLLNNLERFS